MQHSPRIRLALCALAAAIAAGSSTPAPKPFTWPAQIEPGLSSGFCDFRDGRFHAGVDVRTYGREGVACVAVADGWVSRLRAASRGYGKAIHLTLDSGVQVLYAHLAEFSPALEETLAAAQSSARKYTVDVALPKDRFRVRRGEVIAYSGSTGATAPHLHFEVRTLEDEPLNPLTNGLALPDDDGPSFPRLAFVPLASEAVIEGGCYPLELEPRRIADGRYQIDDTLHFSGNVGMAATVVDRVDRRSGRLTPYELQVWSDGSQLTRAVFDRFRFDEVKHVDYALEIGALRARGTELFCLYQRPGDTRERVEFLRSGRVSPAPSTRPVHHGKLVALDAAGNRSEVSFIYTDSLPEAPRATRRPLAQERWRQSHVAVDLDGAFFLGDFAVVPVDLPRHRLTERRHIDDHEEFADTVYMRASELFGNRRVFSEAHPSFSPDDEDVSLAFSAIAAADSGTIPVTSGIELDYPVQSVFADQVVFAAVDGKADPGRQRRLAARSLAVRLGPAAWVFKKNAVLRFAFEGAGARDGVYRAGNKSGPWSYVTSTVDSSGVRAAIDRPGVFAVFRDDAAPWLGKPEAVKSVSYATGAERSEIHIPVDDEGAGFDESRTQVFVGGTEQIWRWDFVAKKIVVALRDASIIGPQPVRVVAFDRIGNSSSVDATVTIEAR